MSHQPNGKIEAASSPSLLQFLCVCGSGGGGDSKIRVNALFLPFPLPPSLLRNIDFLLLVVVVRR